jgi:hypothetical protein
MPNVRHLSDPEADRVAGIIAREAKGTLTHPHRSGHRRAVVSVTAELALLRYTLSAIAPTEVPAR